MAADLRGDLLGAETAVGRQWTGVLAGPIAWSLQLLAGYPLAQEHCHSAASGRASLSLAAVSAGALLVTALGALIAGTSMRSADRRSTMADGRSTIFMARLGLGTAALFGLLVIATAVGLMLNACD